MLRCALARRAGAGGAAGRAGRAASRADVTARRSRRGGAEARGHHPSHRERELQAALTAGGSGRQSLADARVVVVQLRVLLSPNKALRNRSAPAALTPRQAPASRHAPAPQRAHPPPAQAQRAPSPPRTQAAATAAAAAAAAARATRQRHAPSQPRGQPQTGKPPALPALQPRGQAAHQPPGVYSRAGAVSTRIAARDARQRCRALRAAGCAHHCAVFVEQRAALEAHQREPQRRQRQGHAGLQQGRDRLAGQRLAVCVAYAIASRCPPRSGVERGRRRCTRRAGCRCWSRAAPHTRRRRRC